MLRLPGLVDVHVHLRVPGGEHKEDFATGTAAALAGGFTQVLAMPNTSPPLATRPALDLALAAARRDARCDVGLYAGASPFHLDALRELADDAVGLKIYLNDTFGPLRVEDLPTLLGCFRLWPRHRLIALHAEGQSAAVAIGLAAAFGRPVHICHVSRREEIELIAAAKARGLPVTCEVTPHHLFLTETDAARLGPLGDMRPRLATQADQDALWDHIGHTVDCIATDHAPHTLAEKASAAPPPGVPGLETALPLMLTAVAQGRLRLERLVALMAVNPRRIFGLPDQPDTWIEVEVDRPYVIAADGLHTKCGWTPFAGVEVTARVQRVVLRGQVAYDADAGVLAPPGSGQVIRSAGHG
ncbi:MAG: amidohydrolase family protein [Caldilineales bacterium]|nr:amidohydrolase family protein [Caldilineales bacterium]MDW8316323.1 amidohydrolase family protein [Anaerolineae bacterium]